MAGKRQDEGWSVNAQSLTPLWGQQELSVKLSKVILQGACIKNDNKADRGMPGACSISACQLGASMTQVSGSLSARSKDCPLLQTVNDME